MAASGRVDLVTLAAVQTVSNKALVGGSAAFFASHPADSVLSVRNADPTGFGLNVLNSVGLSVLKTSDAQIDISLPLQVSATGRILGDAGSIASLINDKWDGGRRFRLTDTITGNNQEASFTLVVQDQNVATIDGLNSTFSVQTQYGTTAQGAAAAYSAVFSTYSQNARPTLLGGSSVWDQNSLIGLGWARGDSNAGVRGLVGEARISSTSASVYAVGAEIYAGNFLNSPAGKYTGAAGSDLFRKTMALALEGGSGLSDVNGQVTVTSPGASTLSANLVAGATSLVINEVLVEESPGVFVDRVPLWFPSVGTVPFPNPMYLTLDDGAKQEIVSCSAIAAKVGTTYTLTISRGAEGTIAATTTFPATTTTVTRALFSSAGLGIGLGGVQDGFRTGIVFARNGIAPGGIGIDMRATRTGGGQLPIALPNSGFIASADAVGTGYIYLMRATSSNLMTLFNDTFVFNQTEAAWHGNSSAAASQTFKVSHAANSDPTTAHAVLLLQTGGASGGDSKVIWRQGAAGTAYALGLDATDSILKFSSTGSLGTGDFLLMAPPVLTWQGTGTPGSASSFDVRNSDNTAGQNSLARQFIRVAGLSQVGDPYTAWQIDGAAVFSAGMDTSASAAAGAGIFKISAALGVGANDMLIARTDRVALLDGTNTRIEVNTTGIGFFAATPIAKPTVTGSRGGNAALADLLTKLASYGLIVNSTTA